MPFGIRNFYVHNFRGVSSRPSKTQIIPSPGSPGDSSFKGSSVRHFLKAHAICTVYLLLPIQAFVHAVQNKICLFSSIIVAGGNTSMEIFLAPRSKGCSQCVNSLPLRREQYCQ